MAAEEGPDDERVAWECNVLTGASCTDCAEEVAIGVIFVVASTVGVVACPLFFFIFEGDFFLERSVSSKSRSVRVVLSFLYRCLVFAISFFWAHVLVGGELDGIGDKNNGAYGAEGVELSRNTSSTAFICPCKVNHTRNRQFSVSTLSLNCQVGER